MHCDAADLASRLARGGLEKFLLREARHSVGNYAVVHREGRRVTVITSPGSCGGYIREGAKSIGVASLMSHALGLTSDPIESDPFGMSFYLCRAPNSPFNILPFTTMFRNLRRLPPGSIVTLNAGRIVRFETYLNRLPAHNKPRSFRAAHDEVAKAIARDMSRHPERKIALMFSGGVDSLVIYQALSKVIDPSRIELVTMEHNDANGPPRAIPVAAAIGASTRIIPGDTADSDVVQETVLEWMSRDAVGITHPHRQLAGSKDTLIIHGQNMDALSKVRMTVLQEFHEAGYFSKAAIGIVTNNNRKLRRDHAFARNIMLTDAYLGDERFQKISAAYMATLYPGAIPDPDPGLNGILRGLLSYQMPNMLAKISLPFDQVEELNKEVAKFKAYLGKGDSSPRMQLDLMRHISLSCTVARRFLGLNIGDNSELYLFPNSGPLISYFCGRQRGLSDANQPKREIYNYAREESGMVYRAMMKFQTSEVADWIPRPAKSLEGSKIFESCKSVIDRRGASELLEGLDKKPEVRDYIKNILEAVIASEPQIEKQVANETAGRRGQLLRIANLLMVLQEAKKRQSGNGLLNCDSYRRQRGVVSKLMDYVWRWR